MRTWNRYLCATIFALSMVSGCDHQPETAKQNPSQTDEKSIEALQPSTESKHQEKDSQLSGQLVNPEPTKPRSNEDPVSAGLRVSQQSIIAESFDLTVVLGVDAGYEIHSLSASPPKIPTQLKLKLPPGFSALEEWKPPPPKRSYDPGGGSVYRGEISFVRKIQVSADAEPGDYLIECSVSYQACNSQRCLRPIEAVLSEKISVSR